MCVATRFPEAIPLRNITAKTVTKALTKFFTTFGLPKTVQTDQGSNFMSRVFRTSLKALGVAHVVASAYHPESQGALERWHQTLKSALRKYCTETGKEWDDGVPLVLFAVREARQDSLGFSPAELVFGHDVRGPLKMLKEEFLDRGLSAKTNVLELVSRTRERLRDACNTAKEALSLSQKKMKKRFDTKAVVRRFLPGDKVLVLFPIHGTTLSARFSGPYVIKGSAPAHLRAVAVMAQAEHIEGRATERRGKGGDLRERQARLQHQETSVLCSSDYCVMLRCKTERLEVGKL
uniref:Integrase catalytic domain-containing protein n=1 Tax=Gasterosteus aculeatus aculeatus TaxID=481459 RepID=A0AAQ4NPP7_GASAC